MSTMAAKESSGSIYAQGRKMMKMVLSVVNLVPYPVGDIAIDEGERERKKEEEIKSSRAKSEIKK